MKYSIYDFYKEFYDIKKLNITISEQKILFLIYDDKYYYYLNQSKFLDFEDQPNILNLIDHISKKYKIDVINYYPVCFCQETLVMALRIINKFNLLERVKISNIPKKYKMVVDYHKKNFEVSYLSSSISKEIRMSKKYSKRYKFHENYIKKYLLTSKKRKKTEFKELLSNMTANNKSIIDVSCGNNRDILDIAKINKFDLIVENDICIEFLGDEKNEAYYTNDDIIFNQMKINSFDIAYCKNTLHHMNNINNIYNILNFLDRIAKKEILIVEICDPRESKGIPRFLNKWLYRIFLKDIGDCFLNESQFKNIIDTKYSECDIEYAKFTNILGTYLIAKIRKERKNENKSRN